MSILISHESPLQLLEQSLEYNDYQYVLPFFYDRYPEYKKFMDNYQGMKILDNGLFEGEVPTIQELIKLIKVSNPTIFIPPDEWNDSISTLKNAKYWMSLKKTGVLEPKLNLMVVLQGKSFSEIEQLYQQCYDLGYRHFAFNHSSIAYQNEVGSVEDPIEKARIGRIQLVRRMWNKNIIKKHHWVHLLGATDVTEFHYYNQALPGVVNSIDTSNPIIFGCKRLLYSEPLFKIKPKEKMEFFFDKEVDSEQLDCILNNIKTFKQIVNKN